MGEFERVRDMSATVTVEVGLFPIECPDCGETGRVDGWCEAQEFMGGHGPGACTPLPQDPCRTDDCDGDPNDGDSYDGYCPSCADRIYSD